MRITLTQQADEMAIGATAVLRIDLAAGAPALASAELVGVTGGAWSAVVLGPGLAITAGTLDLAGGGSGYVLPAATSKALGGVIVGANLGVSSGTISLSGANVAAALGYTPLSAAPVTSVAGRSGAVTLSAADVSGLAKVATSGAYGDLSGTPAAYTLPAATAKALGGVIVGANLSVAGDGTVSLAGAGVIAALGLTPVDAAGAAAAAPVQSVGGSTGTVALAYGMTVDFSQGAVPAAGTITLDGRLAGAVTIAAVDHCVGTAGGTIDLALQIVSSGTVTPIGGLSAISSTSSGVTTTAASSANKGAAGDRLELVISKVTGTPAGAHITIRGTRP